MTEQRAAHRPRQKSDGIAAERRQRARERIEGREERPVEDEPGRGGIDQEIIPFDDGAKTTCEHDGIDLGALDADDRRRGHNGHWSLLLLRDLQRRNISLNQCKQHAVWARPRLSRIGTAGLLLLRGAQRAQFAPVAGTLISVGSMIAAAISSRHNPAKACNIVTKPPCWYSHATSPTDAPAAVKPTK